MLFRRRSRDTILLGSSIHLPSAPRGISVSHLCPASDGERDEAEQMVLNSDRRNYVVELFEWRYRPRGR